MPKKKETDVVSTPDAPIVPLPPAEETLEQPGPALHAVETDTQVSPVRGLQSPKVRHLIQEHTKRQLNKDRIAVACPECGGLVWTTGRLYDLRESSQAPYVIGTQAWVVTAKGDPLYICSGCGFQVTGAEILKAAPSGKDSPPKRGSQGPK
jgi:predicted RNA-binding Zn-ribbon protein involved in translation (DUF1610 family)